MDELAFVLVIILWVLYYRKTKSLTERVTMLEEENDQLVAKINEMLK
tara:strand:+ start:74 stop:214 length:141 start_codon:yes stop_codon:yes gene_type:complete